MVGAFFSSAVWKYSHKKRQLVNNKNFHYNNITVQGAVGLFVLAS